MDNDEGRNMLLFSSTKDIHTVHPVGSSVQATVEEFRHHPPTFRIVKTWLWVFKTCRAVSLPGSTRVVYPGSCCLHSLIFTTPKDTCDCAARLQSGQKRIFVYVKKRFVILAVLIGNSVSGKPFVRVYCLGHVMLL